MIVGLLHVEVHVPGARSLKDKRSVVKSLRDQLRGRFNVAVAEVDANETWQRATVGVAALGSDRAYVQGLVREVADWLRAGRVAGVIRIEEDYMVAGEPHAW